MPVTVTGSITNPATGSATSPARPDPPGSGSEGRGGSGPAVPERTNRSARTTRYRVPSTRTSSSAVRSIASAARRHSARPAWSPDCSASCASLRKCEPMLSRAACGASAPKYGCSSQPPWLRSRATPKTGPLKRMSGNSSCACHASRSASAATGASTAPTRIVWYPGTSTPGIFTSLACHAQHRTILGQP